MSLPSTIRGSFERSFTLYWDLVDGMEEGALGSKLPGLPSNSVGLQLWCVVGARESYARAIRANEWSGFSCSLETPDNRISVADALRRSAEGVTEILRDMDSFSEVQNRLMLDLLEHEAAHQGQLIRYLYGLKLAIPGSWKSRYALE